MNYSLDLSSLVCVLKKRGIGTPGCACLIIVVIIVIVVIIILEVCRVKPNIVIPNFINCRLLADKATMVHSTVRYLKCSVLRLIKRELVFKIINSLLILLQYLLIQYLLVFVLFAKN